MIHPTDFDAAPPVDPSVIETAPPRAPSRMWLGAAVGASIIFGAGWLVTASQLQDARGAQASLESQLTTEQQGHIGALQEAERLRQRVAAMVPSLQASLRIDTVDCFRVDNNVESAQPAEIFESGINDINLRFHGANPLRDLSDFTTTVEITVMRPDGLPLSFKESGPVTATISCVASEATCSGGFGWSTTAPFPSGTWQVTLARDGRRVGQKTFEVR